MTSHEALDTTVNIPTPENIAFHFRIAGPFRRFPAYAIDFGIRAAILTAATMALVLAFGTGAGIGLILTLFFLLDWFYGAVCEGFFNGRTLGKKAMRLRVVSTDGLPISPAQAILRNFLRAADYMPIFLLPVAVSCFLTRRFQRLGDVVAGTMVVLEESTRIKAIAPLTDPQVVSLAESLSSRFESDRPLALALIAYIERRPTLSPPRRFEVSAHLAQPIAAKLDLPGNTNPDLLLCALHKRLSN